jgi:ribonucleoside-diphosphate reductase alpha chain
MEYTAVKDEGDGHTEWQAVGTWMWENKEVYNGLSVLPYWDHTYQQAPFEDISLEEYEKRLSSLHKIDLSKVMEIDDNVEFGQTAACAGGACAIE